NNGSNNEFDAIAQDPAGNRSTPSDPWTIHVDTAAPPPPLILSLIDDSGAEDVPVGPGESTSDRLPEITGTAEPGSIVSILVDGEVIGSAEADKETGNWSFQTTDPIVFGDHVITATATDAAGNVSEVSDEFDITVTGANGFTDFEEDDNQTLFLDTPINMTSGVIVTTLKIGPFGTPTMQNAPISYPAGIDGKYINLADETVLKIEFPAPTEKFQFLLWGFNGGTVVVTPYDTNGNALEPITLTAPTGPLIPITVDYSMPEGLDGIAYFELETNNDLGGVAFDRLQWGTGAPLPETSDSNSNAVDSDANSLENLYLVEENQEATIQAVGGEGIDTLKLAGANQTLDLSALGDQVSSMEIIDITGTGDNTLNLTLGDVLAQGGDSLFTGDDSKQMMIKGNAGDVVNLDDLLADGTDPGDWAGQGQVTVEGIVYNVFQHDGLNAQLLVQDGVTTNLV
ncbi:Ig-like domain-containing protein, partial [Pseudomonas yamanorum]